MPIDKGTQVNASVVLEKETYEKRSYQFTSLYICLSPSEFLSVIGEQTSSGGQSNSWAA